MYFIISKLLYILLISISVLTTTLTSTQIKYLDSMFYLVCTSNYQPPLESKFETNSLLGVSYFEKIIYDKILDSRKPLFERITCRHTKEVYNQSLVVIGHVIDYTTNEYNFYDSFLGTSYCLISITTLKNWHGENYTSILHPIPFDYKYNNNIVLGYMPNKTYNNDIYEIKNITCFNHLQDDVVINCSKFIQLYITKKDNKDWLIDNINKFNRGKFRGIDIIWGSIKNYTNNISIPYNTSEVANTNRYYIIYYINDIIIYQKCSSIIFNTYETETKINKYYKEIWSMDYQTRKTLSIFNCSNNQICSLTNMKLISVYVTDLSTDKGFVYIIPKYESDANIFDINNKLYEYNRYKNPKIIEATVSNQKDNIKMMSVKSNKENQLTSNVLLIILCMTLIISLLNIGL